MPLYRSCFQQNHGALLNSGRIQVCRQAYHELSARVHAAVVLS